MSENAGLQLPFGRLSHDSGNSSFVITLPVARSIAPIEQLVQRLLTRLEGDQWLRPELEVEGTQVRLRYRWPEELYPVSEVASKWRSSTQRNLPHWFHLAECLLTASSCIKPVGLFPFTPATVFVTASGNKGEALGFKFAAIPALPFGLRDWAASDPLTWQWTNPSTFLQPDDFDGNYAAAAALHFCLIGSLVPKHLPHREQFLRFLSGRTGRDGLFQKCFSEALPDSMKDEEAATLSQKLVQELRRRQSAAQEGEDGLFAYAQKNITILRLANRWEYEKQPAVALQLWLDHEKWQGSRGVSWWRVTRLCEMLHKQEEAEQSVFKGLSLGQEDSVEKALAWIHFRLRKPKKEQHLASMMRLMEACEKVISSEQISRESYDIKIAHLLLRYGNGAEAALFKLQSLIPSNDWQKVQCNLLMVKIHLSASNLSNVSQLCQESVGLLGKGIAAPSQSLSAMTYFYLMDAIANFSAIAKWKDSSYLKDAFSLFTKAMEKAIGNDDSTMIDISGQWLIWIKTFVEYFPEDLKVTVRLAVSAFLEILKYRGVYIAISPGTMPSQPWYPDNLIFEQTNKALDFTT